MATDFTRLGWRMHLLPDTTVYFTHPGFHATVDMDLRRVSTMREVSGYIGSALVPPPGWEVWLHRLAKGDSLASEHYWIHHDKRLMIKPASTTGNAEHASATDSEKLKMEKAYWNYVEMHPAHLVLSADAIGEAADILTWAYTGTSQRLLPSVPHTRSKFPAFSQRECQELSEILRTLDGDSPNHALMRTRVVAKIMHRMCLWRLGQLSPGDYNQGRSEPEGRGRSSIARRAVDVAITTLCLGIPIFLSNRSGRVDHGSAGIRSAAGSMLVVGAVACMIAAVILGASVTLISIPGLNELSRIASFVSIILSASSLVSAILAIFQWKTVVDQQTSYDLPEGMLFISRRSVLLSLPLVFLIWAIAAFICGIVLHMLRGFMSGNPSIPGHVQKYVQWAVVGTVGGLVGMLFACGLILL
ncbi:hypothetical protein K488DRAFT_54056 [Vararia minispora EC-137]|uniref:Uncharacterized protein n=1 Tax=Vararia minispora EC-137 TaxID=1314806 RepID=A0ACB8QFD4_9AGAM|nr:hypothetical protein K488DRAFT_54056 [Vararia minispora EC-137]